MQKSTFTTSENPYFIRRRIKPLTDCDSKSKHLNGWCSLERKLKRRGEWPNILELNHLISKRK